MKTFYERVEDWFKDLYRGFVIGEAEDNLIWAKRALARRLLKDYLGGEDLGREFAVRIDVDALAIREIQDVLDDVEYLVSRGEDFKDLARKALRESDTDLNGIYEAISDEQWASMDSAREVIDSAAMDVSDYDRNRIRDEIADILRGCVNVPVNLDYDYSNLDDILLAGLDNGDDLYIDVKSVDLRLMYNAETWDSDIDKFGKLSDFANSYDRRGDNDVDAIVKYEDLTPELLVKIENSYAKCSILIVQEDDTPTTLNIRPAIAGRLKNIYVLRGKTKRVDFHARLPYFNGHVRFMDHLPTYLDILEGPYFELRERLYAIPQNPLVADFEGLSEDSEVIVEIPYLSDIEIHIDSDSPTTYQAVPSPYISMSDVQSYTRSSNVFGYFSPNIRFDPYGRFTQGPLHKKSRTIKYYRALEFADFVRAFENTSFDVFDKIGGYPDSVFLSEKGISEAPPTLFVFQPTNWGPQRFMFNERVPQDRIMFANTLGTKESRGTPPYCVGGFLKSHLQPPVAISLTPGIQGDLRGRCISATVIDSEFARENNLEGAVLYNCAIAPDVVLPDDCTVTRNLAEMYSQIIIREPKA